MNGDRASRNPVGKLSGPGLMFGILPVILAIWGFVAVFLLQLAIDAGGEERWGEQVVEEMMYFPSGRYMRPATIEYEVLAADVVWLRAVQYYGRQLMTDRNYQWLGHIFEILTELDPRFIGAYHFGALTLAWHANEPEQAIEMLKSGMKRNPTEWQLAFDAGFISYMRTRDYETAARYFRIASELPGSGTIMSRWAAFSAGRAGSFEQAREMWLEIYRNTDNPELKALVVRQLKALRQDEDIGRLQFLVDRFQEERGRLPVGLGELVRAGYIDQLPAEPYGGRYFLDGETIRSTTPAHER